ncbi:MAG: hypothetical protein ABID04_01050 [Patescibacteria group bacterium]
MKSDELNQFVLLTPIARGKLFLKHKKAGLNYQEIAKRIKRSPAYVVNSVRLLKLPPVIQDGLSGGLISEGHARALIAIAELKDTVELYKIILRQKLSVRETENLVRQKVKGQEIKPISKEKTQELRDQISKTLEKDFKQISIKISRRGIAINLA